MRFGILERSNADSHLGDEVHRLAPRLFVSPNKYIPVPDAILAEGRKQLIRRLMLLEGVEIIEET